MDKDKVLLTKSGVEKLEEERVKLEEKINSFKNDLQKEKEETQEKYIA